MSRRKELYEAKNPETKQGARGRRGSGAGEISTRKSKTDNLSVLDSAAEKTQEKSSDAADKLSFASDTAEKTGESDRTIRRYVFVAEKIDAEVQEVIADLPIADNQAELSARFAVGFLASTRTARRRGTGAYLICGCSAIHKKRLPNGRM